MFCNPKIEQELERTRRRLDQSEGGRDTLLQQVLISANFRPIVYSVNQAKSHVELKSHLIMHSEPVSIGEAASEL